MIIRLLQKMGVNPRQLRVLLATSIRLDFRGHRGFGQQKRKIPPLFMSMLFYFFMSIGLAGGLVSLATTFSYSLLILSYSMVMVIFSVMIEFGNTIVNPEDGDILTFRPITSRTYFLARLFNLIFYVCLIGGSLVLVPSLLGIALKGAPVWFPLIFIPVTVLGNIAAASLVVLVYTGLLQILPYQKFKDLLAYLQVVFSFFVFFSYQFVPRLAGRFFQEGIDIQGKWLYWAPPAWFAGAVQICLGRAAPKDYLLGAEALIASILLCVVAFRKISLQYSHRIANLQAGSAEKSVSEKKRSKAVKAFHVSALSRLFLRTSTSIAGYQLGLNMIRRDRTVKMTVFPMLGIPLAFLALAIIEGEMNDPFASGGMFQGGTYGNMVIFFVFFMVQSLLTGLLYSSDWKAAWVFHVAPLSSPTDIFTGLKVAIFLRGLLPFYFILFLIYSIYIPPLHALQLVILLIGFGLLSLSMATFFIKEYPFSKPRVRGERTRNMAFLFVVAPIFGLFIAFFYLLHYGDFIWWIYLILVVTLWFSLEHWASRRLNKSLRRALH